MMQNASHFKSRPRYTNQYEYQNGSHSERRPTSVRAEQQRVASHYARPQLPASRAPDSILITLLVSEIVCSASLGFNVFLF